MTSARRFFTLVFAFLLASVMIGCANTGSGRTETAGEAVDDAVLTTKVKAAIFNEPSLKVTQIGVETYKGQVQLSGFVNSQAEVARAGEVARSVNGVRTVKNDLRLR
jgi:osmotically-inducible protein OsmY